MEWAFVINLVAVLSKGYTILTFLISLMLSFTLSFDFFEISLEALMLHEFIIVWKAVDAFLAWTMVAWLLDFLDSLFSDSKTIDALRVGSMIAMRFFNFFVCFWLIGLLFLK